MAVMAILATGGWIFGRMVLEPRIPATEGTWVIRKNRSLSKQAAPVFAAGSPRGLWMDRVKKAKASDFPKLNGEWETVFPYDERYEGGYPPNAFHALRWMMGMWLVKDPDGFLNAVSGESFEHAHWAAQAMVELMPEKSAEMIFGQEGKELHGFFVGSVAAALAETNPALYLKMNPEGTIDLTPGTTNYDWLTAITSLAKTDALAAGNASLHWKVENAPRTLCDALLSVAKAWKTSDPPISEWVNGIPDPKVRNFAGHAWLSALAETDPDMALKQLYAANLEDDNDLDHHASTEILKHLAMANPVEALKLLKDLESEFSKAKYGNEFDPFRDLTAGEEAELAASPFRHLSPGRYASGDNLEDNGVRFAVLNTIAENLPNDPAGLIAALRGLTGRTGVSDVPWGHGVEAYLIRLKCRRWTADDCLAVAETWTSEAKTSQVDETLQKLATRAATADPDLVLAGLERFPESARSFMMGEIIKQLPTSDSARRIELLSQLPAEQWDRDLGETLGRHGGEYASIIASQPVETSHEVRKAFAGEWGEQDPEAVVEWLQSLPDDAGAQSVAGGLASAWIRYDGDAATAWAGALSSDPVRDTAAESISHWLSMKDSQQAWHWAETISDAKTRAEAYRPGCDLLETECS